VTKAKRGRGAAWLVLFGAAQGPEAALEWAQVNEGDGIILARGLSSPPAATPERTILVLPGEEAQLRRVTLPAGSLAQARAAAGYVFEGGLAAAEDVHYAVGATQNADGARLVAAMSAARLTRWLERCRALGAEPGAVFLDVALWPVENGEAAIVLGGERTVIAGGELGGFAIDAALAASVFERWEAQNGPRRLAIFGPEAHAWRARYAAKIAAIAPEPVDLVAALAPHAIAPPHAAPDLRQGEFARGGQRPSPIRFWRLAAALVVVSVLLQAGAAALAGWRDGRAAAEITRAAEKDFRAARPDVKRIVNLHAQARALVNAQRQSTSHPLLAASEPIIKAQQADARARLDELRYEGDGRKIVARFSALDPAALEAAAAALRAEGLKLDSRETRPEAGRYTIEFAIETPT
jgi:type II secretion system protein L